MRTLFTRLALALVLLASLTASECYSTGHFDWEATYTLPEPGTEAFTRWYGSDIGRYVYDLGFRLGWSEGRSPEDKFPLTKPELIYSREYPDQFSQGRNDGYLAAVERAIPTVADPLAVARDFVESHLAWVAVLSREWDASEAFWKKYREWERSDEGQSWITAFEKEHGRLPYTGEAAQPFSETAGQDVSTELDDARISVTRAIPVANTAVNAVREAYGAPSHFFARGVFYTEQGEKLVKKINTLDDLIERNKAIGHPTQTLEEDRAELIEELAKEVERAALEAGSSARAAERAARRAAIGVGGGGGGERR